MKNKKVSIILSGILMMTMATPVFANINQDSVEQSGKTDVSYEVGQSYTITIPASFDFTAGNLSKEETVTAEDVLIENGKTLKVKMSSANYVSGNAYTLNYGTDEISKIPYSIKLGENDFTNGNDVLTVAAGTTEATSENLTFSTEDANIQQATKSGNHTDTLTFTVSVE